MAKSRANVKAGRSGAPREGAGGRRFDTGGPTLRDVGERELLRLLVGIARELGDGAAFGVGDDAARWRPADGLDVAVTQDALVEGVDFERRWTTPRQLGRRALAAALSDLAGSGAQPTWCLASLCAPASTDLEDVLEIQRGLCIAATEHGCAAAGGDVSDITGPIVLDVSAAGTVVGKGLRRDRGCPADLLVVTGLLGSAAAGLRALRDADPGRAPVEAEARWVQAQVAPRARVAEGVRLAEAGVDTGGDVSDGLLADAERLAGASACAAELWREAIPVDPALRAAFPEVWSDLALAGGEDFELLVAVRPAQLDALVREWPSQLAPLTVVGRLTQGAGVRLREHEDGRVLPLPRIQSRHFA
jgi:thiamine-monophosphate kinase